MSQGSQSRQKPWGDRVAGSNSQPKGDAVMKCHSVWGIREGNWVVVEGLLASVLTFR